MNSQQNLFFYPLMVRKVPMAVVSSKDLIDKRASTAALTKRELEIAYLLVTGLTVKFIAQVLKISPYTVNDHMKSIYKKLGVNSKSSAICELLGVNRFLPTRDNEESI